MENVTKFPSKMYAVTLSDSATFPASTLYIGVGGNVKFIPSGEPGSPITVPMVSGSYVPCRAIGVYLTGTTATSIFRIED